MKLAPHNYEPYRVLERIGPVAYQLELLESLRIHPVFIVSCLKKQFGNLAISSTVLPMFSNLGLLDLTLEAILDLRLKRRNNRATTKLLI